MKKTITILALAFCITDASAQDLTSKKGETILPEQGDWSLGIDANPFLEYMGNFFGKTTTNNAPTFNFLNSNQTITGKYFVEAQMAYRASLRIGLGSETQRRMVANRTSSLNPNTYPAANPEVENKLKRSSTDIGLAVGMEKRKGKTRLQGFYGAEVGINFSSSKDKYTYGNALNTSTTTPVNVDPADNFGTGNVTSIPVSGVIGNARITERKNGATFTFGLRAFIGVEYFVLPKISLGGEFGWGLGLSTTGKTKTTYESVGNKGTGGPNETGTTTIEGAKGGSFALDTDNTNSIFGPSASLRLNFHF
jgi:hypothetical protein